MVDAVIVGGGLSGLTLCAQLATTWADRRVLLVDDGRHDVSTRSWAFWMREPGPLGPPPAHTWDRIGVHAAGSSSIHPLQPYRYATVCGASLNAVAHERISRLRTFEVMAGSVERVRDLGTHATVSIDGAEVTADWVFDSRPATPLTGPVMSFLGWEVVADSDAFDPGVATFMDFRGRPPGRVAFCYLLPATSRHALVETVQVRWDDDAVDLQESLTGYLSDVCGLSSWAVRRTEAGSLPLLRPRPAGGGRRVVPIGRRGGMLKSSTGFALGRIRRHTAAISASLAAHGHPHAVPPPHRRHPWLDGVLLDVLHREPDLVEVVFDRLFRRNGAASVLRFLDEDATLHQEAGLVATLPRGPFLRAAVRLATAGAPESAAPSRG